MFSRSAGEPIYGIAATGGTPVAVTELDKTHEETGHAGPRFLPGGKQFVYLARSSKPEYHNVVYLGSLDSKVRTKLTESTGWPAFFAARAHIEAVVARAEGADGWAQGHGRMASGMRRLVLRMIEANLSQIEYVQHHAGRYAVIGHNERFICAGEAMCELQLRNKFYFAHLETVEEGAADMDVGIRIFTGLNIKHGLAVPVLVHFRYSSRVPGARERAVLRCKRVKAAIAALYPHLHEQGLLRCQMAVSELHRSERCTFIVDDVKDAGH